ncbi:MAG: 1-acyl-sn-glycerol-3-phosphate acyltransferase [Thermodesulfobacteriota bacterium]|nr:1-acyl-sn-glycerol-3-phosphate acyltransferase [Thermodesulfobacteriota bacterium]
MIPWLKNIYSGFGRFTRSYTDKVLGGTYDHFLAYLPHKSGRLNNKLLDFVFSRVSVSEDRIQQIQQMAENGIIVYVNKNQSKMEYICCNKQYHKYGLPVPELGIGYNLLIFQPVSRLLKIFWAHVDYFFRHFSFLTPYKNQYFKKALASGIPAFFSLFGGKTFYPRLLKSKTNPVQELISLQKTIDTPIILVPQAMFFSKRPPKTKPGILDFFLGGLSKKPGKLRRLFILFYNPKNTFIEIAEPLNLKHFIDRTENAEMRDENLALALRRVLLSSINQTRQRVTGPLIKSREEIKENIMGSARLQRFIEQHAAENEKTIQEVNKETYNYLDEIAANYSMNWIMVYDFILTWMLNHIFDGMVVDYENLARLKGISETSPLIFVPTHKSHLDYLVLSYVLYNNRIACPHIAAGKNLSFWPLGPIFRGGGAFFMRRTFKGQKLYSRVFLEYIHKILEEGFNLEFFLEGGRSRSGKMLTPKTGLLSIILEAYNEGACKDMIFVPVNIGYDRIIEEASYIHELEGGEKKAENLPQLLNARKSLKTRYGKVYVNFNEPISLNQHLSRTQSDLNAMQPSEKRGFITDFSRMLTKRIDDVTTATPYCIVSAAILNCPRKRFTYDYLMSIMETYLFYLQARHVKLADTITSDHAHAFGHVLESFESRKFIEQLQIDSDQKNPLYMVNEDKRPAMEYYKNNSIYFFAPAAYIAMALLQLESFRFSSHDIFKEYEFLEDFFKKEFTPIIEKTTEQMIRICIKIFIDAGMVMPHETRPDTYDLTADGLKKLQLFAGFLYPYFESYLIALTYIKNEPDVSEGKGDFKKILSHGRKMYKNSQIERLEAVSTPTLKNAYKFFTDQAIIGDEDPTKADFYEDKILKYLALLA